MITLLRIKDSYFSVELIRSLTRNTDGTYTLVHGECDHVLPKLYGDALAAWLRGAERADGNPVCQVIPLTPSPEGRS